MIDQLAKPTRGIPDGVVDTSRVAIAGHSLGGADVYGVAYNSCCRDEPVRAAMAFEGLQPDFPNGRYTWHGAPLLVVAGDVDPIVPRSVAVTVQQRLHTTHSTAYVLTIIGGAHGGGLHSDDPGHATVLATVRAFLDAALENDATARTQLTRRFGSSESANTH